MSGWENWLKPEPTPVVSEENVLKPEVARRLIAYGVRRGLLRHRLVLTGETPVPPEGKEGYGS